MGVYVTLQKTGLTEGINKAMLHKKLREIAYFMNRAVNNSSNMFINKYCIIMCL